MKKTLASLLCMVMLYSATAIHADDNNLNSIAKETEDIYRTGSGAQSGVFSSLSLSMLGWGVGLAAGIAILASVLHQSTSSSNHDSCSFH